MGLLEMIIKLNPQRTEETVTYEVSGTDFLIDGTAIDLSGDWVKLEPDTEGEPLEPTGNLKAGERDSDTGEITLTVRAPHVANAPESERFPEPIELNDGESVTFPRWEPEPETTEDTTDGA